MLLKKFAFLLIPFFIVACGSDEEAEDEGAAANTTPKPKKKKGKEKVRSDTGKTLFIETCKDIYDGFYDNSGRDKSIKLFDPTACSTKMLEVFYDRRDEKPKDSISFTAENVLYDLSRNPQYWSKEKKDKMRKQQQEKDAARLQK